MPKVSVIIPVYGVEQYIERCARSLFEQTLDDIEYLFIDDCTPDNSIGLLQQVLEDYPNRKHQVVIHRMDQNSGQAKVREWGIRNSKGEFIIHCDTDDWVDLQMYEKMYNQAVQNGSDVVVCDYYAAQDTCKQRNAGLFAQDKYSVINDILTWRISCSVWNKLVSRKIFIENSIVYPTNNMGEDGVLNVQFLWYSKKISYLPEPLYYYFANPASITNAQSEDKIRQKYFQAVANAGLIASFLKKNEAKQFDPAITKYFFEQTHLLVPLAKKNRRDLALWKNGVKFIYSRVFHCPFLSIKNKLGFYVLLFISKICIGSTENSNSLL